MEKEQTKKYTLYAHGMHCKSCSILIENELTDVPFVKKVHADVNTHVVIIEADTDVSHEELATELTKIVFKDGYTLSVNKQEQETHLGDFTYSIPIALVLIVAFVLLQKLGLVNLITAEKVSYPVAFGVGLVASASSCLAVVGGLLLSVSANFAKQGKKIKLQVLFHVGRLISFFVFGGVIGLIGSAFTLSVTTSFILSVLVGMVMLILGINLLDVFPWAKRLQFNMPNKLGFGAHTLKKFQFSFTPFLVGVSTFFLPCGFTQSMQIYSLSTGSFVTGALTMTAFALGTLPVLGLISFTSMRFGEGKFASVFFKTAGILVVAFGIMTILNGLVARGIIQPFINF